MRQISMAALLLTGGVSVLARAWILVLLLSGCGLGYSRSVMRDDGTGRMVATTTTTSVGITEPARVASAGEMAAADVIASSAIASRAWNQAAIDQYRTTGIPPYYYGYGTPGLVANGQYYTASGMMLGGAPVAGMIGGYTAAGTARTNELAPNLSAPVPTYTIIQGAATGDSPPPLGGTNPPPPPPPPSFGGGGSTTVPASPLVPNPTPSASSGCLTSEIGEQITATGTDIGDLLDARNFDQVKARALLIKIDDLLKQAETQCTGNEHALDKFGDLRDEVVKLRKKLRKAGPMAPALRAAPVVPGCDPSIMTCTP